MRVRSHRRCKECTGLISFLPGLLLATVKPACAQNTSPNSPSVPAVSAASASPPASPSPPLIFSALLDAYYAYNFNKPSTIGGAPGYNGPGAREFDFSDNSFSLALVELGVGRPAADTSRLGFTLRVIYGPSATRLFTGSTTGAANVEILQGYGTYLIPLQGKDMTVDAGRFVSHMGYEVVEPELNWNYSRSDLFLYFTPDYHTGLRAALPFGSTFTATGYIYNGWNDASVDNNVGKAYGFALAFTPSSKWTLNFNGLASPETDTYFVPPSAGTSAGIASLTPTNLNRAKNVLEPIVTYNFSPTITAVVDANFDFGDGASPASPNNANGSWNASGVACYLHYAMRSGSSITFRGETFDDKNGFLTGNNGEKGAEMTLTYGIKSPMFAGAETRFEYRYDSLKDSAGDGLFMGANGALNKKNQSTLSISENLSF